MNQYVSIAAPQAPRSWKWLLLCYTYSSRRNRTATKTINTERNTQI